MATKKAAPEKKVDKKELSVNNYIALIVVGSVLMLLAAGFFGYKLIQANIKNGKVIGGKIQALQDLDKKLVDANNLVDNYHNLSSSERQLIDSALPIKRDFSQIVSLLESAGTNANARIKSVTADNQRNEAATAVPVATTTAAAGAPATPATPPPAASNEPKPFYYVVSIEGNYTEMTTFFRNMELSTRPMNVKAFNLRGNTGALIGELTIQTFYQDKADISDKTQEVK